jgi:hypothetical protein
VTATPIFCRIKSAVRINICIGQKTLILRYFQRSINQACQ